MQLKDKATLRQEILAKRDAIPPAVRKAKDRAIGERLLGLEEFRAAHMIFYFASFRSEVDTSGLIRKSLESDRKVVLPKVDAINHALLLFEIRSPDELAPGYMSIPEPSVIAEERQVNINDVDAVIIPGACFDESGNRIGYGGGYYDRLLEGLRKDIPVIAPAYEEQIVDSIPADPHDRKVTIIITDRRQIRPLLRRFLSSTADPEKD
jgi:5-formyltetrahydrofolate cyclo-ligase